MAQSTVVLKRIYTVKLCPSAATKAQLTVASKITAICWNELLILQKKRLLEGAMRPMTAKDWSINHLRRVRQRPGMGILANIAISTHDLTAVALNRQCRAAFLARDSSRLPKLKDPLVDFIRYGADALLEQTQQRIFLPKIGWIKYQILEEVTRNMEGEVRRMTVYRQGGFWYASIFCVKYAEIANRKTALLLEKRNAKAFKAQKDALQTEDDWMVDLHEERESNLL